MKQSIILTTFLFFHLTFYLQGQTKQDSSDIKQVAFDYIESQHDVKLNGKW